MPCRREHDPASEKAPQPASQRAGKAANSAISTAVAGEQRQHVQRNHRPCRPPRPAPGRHWGAFFHRCSRSTSQRQRGQARQREDQRPPTGPAPAARSAIRHRRPTDRPAPDGPIARAETQTAGRSRRGWRASRGQTLANSHSPQESGSSPDTPVSTPPHCRAVAASVAGAADPAPRVAAVIATARPATPTREREARPKGTRCSVCPRGSRCPRGSFE